MISNDIKVQEGKAIFHLPGLFEFYEFYNVFLPLFYNRREYFYDFCEIGSIYGAPSDAIWGGGRIGYYESNTEDVLELISEYNVSARLAFSNSLISEEHLADKKCNRLCSLFENGGNTQNGVIIYSDLLLNHIKKNYPGLYFVSTTTKVITSFLGLKEEIDRDEYKYVVPDFRLNKCSDLFSKLNKSQKDKVEFLCNEACDYYCKDRKACYEAVSRKVLSIDGEEHICKANGASDGYVFSRAMENPGFIGIEDIRNTYVPAGFSNFKIEGRNLGSALLLEFLLYYMTKLEYQLKVREKIYLNASLDLF